MRKDPFSFTDITEGKMIIKRRKRTQTVGGRKVDNGNGKR